MISLIRLTTTVVAAAAMSLTVGPAAHASTAAAAKHGNGHHRVHHRVQHAVVDEETCWTHYSDDGTVQRRCSHAIS